MRSARALSRRLALVLLLVILALIRVDRSMAELQGHSGELSRLFHVAPALDGCWDLTLMGFDRRVPSLTRVWADGRPLLGGGAAEVLARTRSQVIFYVEQIKRALP